MREWPARDSRALFAGTGEPEAGLAVLVLNHELPPCTPRLWRAAALRVAADGGANRLYDELPALLPQLSAQQVREQYVPHVVLGDLDSARPEVLAFYAARGARVIDASADQDTNDLHKCVAFALAEPACGGSDPGAAAARHLVALGALGGRLDHELAALSVLHAFPDARITLLGRHAAATLLAPGTHRLRPCPPTEGPVCGLVPIAGPAVASSTGLRWDLSATRLAVGELVSTSNAIVAHEVTVETDAPLVWTTQLHFAAAVDVDAPGADARTDS